jgi:hypothetical protein
MRSSDAAALERWNAGTLEELASRWLASCMGIRDMTVVG